MPLTLAAPQPGLTSDLDLPYLVIVADSYGDYVFTRLHPMQAQGEVGMGPCWDRISWHSFISAKNPITDYKEPCIQWYVFL